MLMGDFPLCHKKLLSFDTQLSKYITLDNVAASNLGIVINLLELQPCATTWNR